jgi:uncharacterized protein
MTTSHAQVIREFFDAFGAADAARLQAITTDDFVWHFPGTSPIAGDWRGVDGLLQGIRVVAMTLGAGQNGFELQDIFANDRAAMSVHRDFFTGAGNHLDLRYAIYYRFVAGKIAEAWEIPFDLAENDRYYGIQAKALAGVRGDPGPDGVERRR